MPTIADVLREEGIVRTDREAVLEILEVRFGDVPLALREDIQEISDPAFLKHLHRQAIQIPVSKFGPVEDETKRVDENHPSLMGALDVMIPIAKKFANNELSRGDLKKAREDATQATLLWRCIGIALAFQRGSSARK